MPHLQSAAAASLRRVRWSRLERRGALAAAGVVLALATIHLWQTPGNPPGFLRDEASISYNAYSLSQSLRDEDGAVAPLYFVSFGDYKSPLFVYALAGVFRVTGPHAEVARGLASASVLIAVLLLGLLAWRRSRSSVVALAVVALAGATPWLYELGRVALEVTLEPLVLVALLLALDRVSRTGAWTPARAVPVGLALAALAYVYAAGRLLAPLLAAALVVFAGRRWRWLLAAWGTFGVALVPLAIHWRNHPGALTARYDATTFVREGMSRLEIVGQGIWNYVRDVNLWEWVVDGDQKPYIHATDYGALLVAVVILALVGAVVALARHRDDPWWRYVLAATVLAPIPAALTEDRLNAVRMVPVPILLVVLTVPALTALRRQVPRNRLLTVGAGLLAVVTLFQVSDAVQRYRESGPGRVELFEAGVSELLDRGFALRGPLHVDFDDHQAQAHALWRSAERGLPRSSVVVLADGGVPAPGSIVFGRFQACDYACSEFDRWGDYWLARATPS